MTRNMAQDHDQLRAMMRDFTILLDRGPPASTAEIMRRRGVFSAFFRAHLAEEDAMVQSLRHNPATPQVNRLAHEHGNAIVELFVRYHNLMHDWTSARIIKEWDAYRPAVRALQEGLYKHLEWEEKHLHPLFPEAMRHAA